MFTSGSPPHDTAELEQLEQAFREGAVNSIVVMSVDSLTNLLAALPQFCLGQLRKTPLVTPSRRVIQTATELLPEAPTRLAVGPTTRDMVKALAASAKLL